MVVSDLNDANHHVSPEAPLVSGAVVRKFATVVRPRSDEFVQFLTGTLSTATVTVTVQCVIRRRLVLHTPAISQR